ncbi:PIN domain-containing protein [Rubellimicrobium rubrum]|uniref:PIN domain-containing protein n=1 Tax=Rubellimicrobium rubrum TaxID=2585369 RepID=A0A5C4MWR5_9RHOB|nr:PIN domain-containing protein [Rubellimicrobium rubrum]TNC50506.1 PIN domain-containing protein [Rubellimicrobium rubrum]
MKRLRVLLDANVLYPTVLREILMGAASEGLYEPLWSSRLLEEWARAAARLGPEGEAVARAEIASLQARWPQAMVTGAEGQERRLWLPDPDDVHVLAAAVVGSADAILTMNAKDFPRGVLAEEGLQRLDPDHFLAGLAQASPGVMNQVVSESVAKATQLSGEEWTTRTLLRKARLNVLSKTLARLSA